MRAMIVLENFTLLEGQGAHLIMKGGVIYKGTFSS